MSLLTSLIPVAKAAGLFKSIELMKPAETISAIDSTTDVWAQMGEMINYLLGAVGVVAFIIILYAGVTILTSVGNDDKIGEARKMIAYAILGLVLIAVSFALNTWLFNSSFFVQTS
ncbi:MAG: hypothetical protein NTZ80_01865 [Patescibacteria group bacterium]|nr:hypothetical protein [Patescibacteria group bacterium]